MDILCLSDLHFELYAHKMDKFFRKLTTKADVLVLAGDICAGWQIPGVMKRFCGMFPRVVYIHGNHEFYRSEREIVLAFSEQACEENPNLSWLDCDTVEIGGVKFHGTPLWFKHDPLAPKAQLGDFWSIKDYESWVYAENQRAIDFLTANVERGDVVVTHHLPSKYSLHPKYAKWKALDPFFLCDVTPLIRDKQPALWLHGHTHSSFDYQIDDTRVVANPHGYEDENTRDFSRTKILTIPGGSKQSTSGPAGFPEIGT